ncbi:hypothetical protein [Streptomyces sp. PTD5-9]|uniref:hypothetical protein n=1 Tax=Streptomyces sp. PTD5-9 TaxID=3120150 RepID=UPI0030084E15
MPDNVCVEDTAVPVTPCRPEPWRPRADLPAVRAQPLPPPARPRWLRWLPQTLVVLVAVALAATGADLTARLSTAALVIGAVQFTAAKEEGTDVSFGGVSSPSSPPRYRPRPLTRVRGARRRASEGGRLPAQKRPQWRTAGRAPALVLAHAGGFHTFDKSDPRGTGRRPADHGVAAIAVDYRLATPDRPTWGKASQDLVTALRAEGVDTTVKELPFAEHAFDDAYGSLTSQTSRYILRDSLTR